MLVNEALPDNADVNGDTTAAEAALRDRLSRKRTKTGCLTCRKRRIKCGEERPMCKNCIKSRRHCDGYIQRVVFKAPNFEYRIPPGGETPLSFHHAPEIAANMMYHPASGPPLALDQPAYSSIHPRPYSYADTIASAEHSNHYFQGPLTLQQPQQHVPTSAHFDANLQQQIQAYTSQQTIFQHIPYPVAPITPSAYSGGAHSSHPSQDAITHQPHSAHPHPPQSPWTTTFSHSTSPTSAAFQPLVPVDSAVYPGLQMAWHGAGQYASPDQSSIRLPSHVKTSPSAHSDTRSLDFTVNHFDGSAYLPDSGPTQLLSNAAIETQDDDYYDVDSDEDSSEHAQLSIDASLRQEAGVMLLMQHLNAVQQLQLRSYDTFLHDGMLDTYRPERVASPLRNEATRRIFLHFITATGPSLSPFERSAPNYTAHFGKHDPPLTQRGIWTHTMPMAALHSQGLLHAMLALASLHIARLQGGSVTPSLQHYAWSLKRIHNAVANPKKRLHLTTIAASMLLGFYEVMTAEHSKWNTHLAGAKQLVLETNFSGMLRQFSEMKRDRRLQVSGTRSVVMPPSPQNFGDDALDQILDVDENLISRFFGQRVTYNQQGYVEADIGSIPRLDLSKLEILKDLYWWYCKQDAYQSIISGNPLLMDYSRWSACPPRAPLGRPDAVYGSFDHLTLLLGRVADFASRDRARKLKVMEQNGGQWRPHPASQMARAPPPGHAGGTKAAPPAGPIFYGMAPAPSSNPRMPTSYQRPGGDKNSNEESQIWELDTALQEYADIRGALDDFKIGLGEAFAPLPVDCHSPILTAFGPALFYRSYDIGCMMAIWNMTVLIIIRSHPYYHPAAHVAAGMATAETAPYAMQVGRISAGIAPGPQQLPLNPALGAALVESCMPSFFAAVQYQDPDQRYETVMRIYNIARRTGWGTADLIANGCETAWVKAAQAGRGPPYTRLVRSQRTDSTDARLTGSWEKQDPGGKPDEDDAVDRRFIRSSKLARLHWAIGVIGIEHDI